MTFDYKGIFVLAGGSRGRRMEISMQRMPSAVTAPFDEVRRCAKAVFLGV